MMTMQIEPNEVRLPAFLLLPAARMAVSSGVGGV